MDKLKELSIKLGGKIRMQKHFNANVDDTSFRGLIVKDYRHFSIKIDEYEKLCSIAIKVNSELCFSINKPDMIFLYDSPKYFSDLTYKIYVSDENINLIHSGFLEEFWKSLAIVLNRIGLSPAECLFVYKNYMYFFVTKERNLELILDNMIDLINNNESVFNRKLEGGLSIKNVPDKLKPLIPYFKKYSISDDSDREQLITEMDRKEKHVLIKLVQPLFDEIKFYLDSFNETPLSEEAILVGQLAELVSELKSKNM